MNWEELRKKLIDSKYHYFHTENGVLLCGNSLKVMNIIPTQSVDLVIADPPYLIGYETNYRKDRGHEFCSPIYNDSIKHASLIKFFLREAFRILRKNAAIYTFCSWKTVDVFKRYVKTRFKIKNIIVWVKNNWTAGDLEAQYGQQYEMIIYGSKGRSRFVSDKRLSDVWFFRRVSGAEQLHQNQKPLDLVSRIIKNHTAEDMLVLDPFLGSGTTAVACERLNRKWIGIEISEKYCEIAQERILGRDRNQRSLEEYLEWNL